MLCTYSCIYVLTLSVISILAPLDINNSAICTLSCSTALCKGVLPLYKNVIHYTHNMSVHTLVSRGAVIMLLNSSIILFSNSQNFAYYSHRVYLLFLLKTTLFHKIYTQSYLLSIKHQIASTTVLKNTSLVIRDKQNIALRVLFLCLMKILNSSSLN